MTTGLALSTATPVAHATGPTLNWISWTDPVSYPISASLPQPGAPAPFDFYNYTYAQEALGQITVSGNTPVYVKFTGEVATGGGNPSGFGQLASYWSSRPSTSAGATYISTNVPNLPTNGDRIGVVGHAQPVQSLSFYSDAARTQPVTVSGIVMNIYSLGGPSFSGAWDFNQVFSILSDNHAVAGATGFVRSEPTPGTHRISASEGSGTIQFNGSFDTISWTVTQAEAFAAWNIGFTSFDAPLDVVFDTQGGSSIARQPITVGSSISDPGTPTRVGYTFAGWFVSDSGGTPLTFPYAHGRVTSFTLYAQWTAVQSTTTPSPGYVPPTPPLPRPERVGDARGENASLSVSQSYYTPGVDVVYLATEDTYADALVAGPRAGTEGGPIILTDPVRMTKAVADEIIRLRPATIVVVGQTSAVGPDVEAAARFLAPNVIRVGGVDRYETAVHMSRRLTRSANQITKVYVASGEDFADAVTSGPIASLDNAPILLTRRNTLPAVTRAELVTLDPTEIVIIGGTDAVSTAVETELRGLADTITRIGGNDRYATAARLSTDRVDTGVDTVFLAVGEQFHHAVVAAPVATTKRTAVLLVQPNCVPLATRNQLDRLRPNKIVVVGADTTNTRRILDLTPCQ